MSGSATMPGDECPQDRAVRARQRLLAILGQLQTYIFQVELLKRCDPKVASAHADTLKRNALQVRALCRNVSGALAEQFSTLVTPLTLTLEMSLAHARAEGERVLSALSEFGESGDAHAYFWRTMGIGGSCPHHQAVSLATYGGQIDKELCFLHDVENFLKQMNYCHLITPAPAAAKALAGVKAFLERTVGSGLVVPPELSDPSHPCHVCFEELCMTANQGATTARRLAGKICDHVTQQARVCLCADEMRRYLPHVAGLSDAQRARALCALDVAESHGAAGAPAGGDAEPAEDCASSWERETRTLLDSHHVFSAAPPELYAVSEMRFWLASGDRSAGSTMDAFASNLSALAERERRYETGAVAVELAAFGRRGDHFCRAFGEYAAAFDMVDSLLVGGQSASPDDQIEALIRACYDRHLAAPVLRQLVGPEHSDTEALKCALESLHASETASAAAPETAAAEAVSDALPEDDAGDWDSIATRAMSDVAERRRLYADRLTKRSLASLGRCVREQRGELEKMLRVSVYGEVLPSVFSAVYNGFAARIRFCEITARARTVVDNRNRDDTFDAHRFMRSSLLRHRVDKALLPGITHQFFGMVNGPLFDHATHGFAQPPNTALYYSVENVGLLPHLKEELARFMVGRGNSDWAVSEFQRFYHFDGTSGITPAQRIAWGYIRELIVATTLFSSVFQCGHIELRRADYSRPSSDGEWYYPAGIYLTYISECPLVAVLECGPEGLASEKSVVVYDRDVFSLLYTVLQHLAEGTAAESNACA
ncbi:DNA packaging terminase subunit 2 UL28 [Leporid alphaherpesvirus 4]|uniref:DNA packaging terminase subunit 2 UL28 n=1 Tax=Leporid alphaherpesvirus 4 TaxID=481315 RepID=J9QVD0_9ALPH|nr:DNA packaging terminase subunit 2 UL28 [Leporid alphaherpesvirus 4]AFR32470.1 DNA packaging terminase subunit 2 UL28 [Leporid alphaherpesvirus 4]